jgi:hypothetical protein
MSKRCLTIDEIKQHVYANGYMGGIARSKERTDITNEVFTPTWLVDEILDKFDQTIFTDPAKTFLDPCCGDGQALVSALLRKIENGSTFEQALSTIFGVDCELDNILLARNRLLCRQEQFRDIVEQNIVCVTDSLQYDFSFNSHVDKDGFALTNSDLLAQKSGLPVPGKPPKKVTEKRNSTTIANTGLFSIEE